MKSIKNYFPLISEVGEVLGILSYFGFTYPIISRHFDQLPLFVKLLIVFAFLSALIKYKGSITTKYDNVMANENLDSIRNLKHPQQILEAIPKKSTIETLLRNIRRRAKSWAEDSILSSFNLYLNYQDENWQTPMLQVYYYSQWKDEEGCFYEGSIRTESFEEGRTFTQPPVIIYQQCPDWRNLVSKALNKVESNISGSFGISVQGNHIRISYSQGKLKKKVDFKIENCNLLED